MPSALPFPLIPLGDEPTAVLLPAEPGRNRNRAGTAQIRAENDVDAVTTWLRNYTGHTWLTHRREAERLMLWCADRGRQLSDMTVEDAQDYRDFLANPQPKERWIGKRHPRTHPEWRPFERALSDASIRHADAVLKGMFTWLHDVGYFAGNPWRALPVLRGPRKARVTRYLDEACWDRVVDFLMTRGDDGDWSRRRFILLAFYHTRARISELAAAIMSDIERRRRPDGSTQWWLHILGKGGVEREVPIPHLVEHLRSYRASRGLPEEPAAMEALPLIAKQRGQGRLTSNALHGIIKDTLGEIASALPPEMKEQLESVSAHWLRHSAATHALDLGESLKSVQATLGHASLQTTSIYVHTEDDKQYEEVLRRGARNN